MRGSHPRGTISSERSPLAPVSGVVSHRSHFTAAVVQRPAGQAIAAAGGPGRPPPRGATGMLRAAVKFAKLSPQMCFLDPSRTAQSSILQTHHVEHTEGALLLRTPIAETDVKTGCLDQVDDALL